VPEPQFKGQTKGELGNSEVTGIVSRAVGEIIGHYLEENPKQAKRIIEKVILAATARHAARKARDMVQRKNVLTGSGLPGKLSDCSLRGKILNVEKAMEYKIYENEEIKNMFTALGVSIEDKEGEGKVLNIEKLRYHKIVIMCDADIDGSHIVTLILTFFFRYMKVLIEEGYLYIAAPPLYMVKKGKQFRYCWNEEERSEAITAYGGSLTEENSNIKIQRYKGLGEMNAEQLWETTMDPTARTFDNFKIKNYIQYRSPLWLRYFF